ncbi:endonuclease/exonuclease/phosphatase family protein [Bifidobacterium sp. 64T4]|uniref:endonuclease/exonuclease/phosphatase family protein n=1 Tax=Bifidobacterium pongonis TaxID=2834432 RepID=UPI001C561795|nr:endonuclease/exonuclease/phosphatase family protein [Bifidobacterium pongonis]MBW3094482.1 endonuclease/exonuclease/phosphatase family protein [Bifidobacterium pongonis]
MTIVLAVLAVLLWCWLLLSCLPAGVEAHLPMPYLIALVPLLWVPSLVLAAVSAYCGAWGMTCAFLLAALMSVARLWPYWLPKRKRGTSRETSSSVDDDQTAAAGTLRVMTVNCRFGRADAEAIVREVRERHIDVLATQETTAGLVSRLREAGIDDVLPYHQSGDDKPTDNGGFNMLFSRFAPNRSTASAIEIPAADVPSMTLDLLPEPGGTGAGEPHHVTFASAHPKSPMRGCPEWSQGIRALGSVAKLVADDPQGIAVVMGDLNSSIEHPSFRALLASGFRDASRTQATRFTITFPSWLVWPHIELDHILFTPGLRPSGVESFIVSGTDHYALTATLTLS